MKYEITQEQVNQLLKLIGEVPTKYGIPLVQFLDNIIHKEVEKNGEEKK